MCYIEYFRTTLEAKAKLYEKLSKEAANMSEEEKEKHWRYLVQFDKKCESKMPNFSDEEDDKVQSSDDEVYTENYEPPKNPDEEWYILYIINSHFLMFLVLG